MIRPIRPCLRIRRITEATARFVRLFSLGATLLYLLVGVGTGPTTPTAGVVAWAIVIGVLFHVYADVGNDVMDLPIDRTDPRRMPDPLAGGSVPPQHALAVTLITLPLMLAVPLPDHAGRAVGSLVAAIALIGSYNIAGKAVPVPFVADLVQGAGWALLVIAGAEVAGGVTPATLWAAGTVVVYIAMVNGLHGAIRDADNDMRAGARTTAVMLGARVLDARRVSAPTGILLYGAMLQAVLGVLVATFLVSGMPSRPALSWGVAVAWTAGLFAGSTAAIVRAYRTRDDLRQAMAAGTWHLFLIPASLLAAVTWRIPGWVIAVTVASFVAPPVLFGWAVRGTDFGMPSSTALGEGSAPPRKLRQRIRAIREMTRLGTPLAAAALAAVGAVLGGGLGRNALPAMAATALAVAAANVYNDRCDRIADQINRPDRPIPTGAVTANDADRFVLAAALGVVATAAAIDAEAAAVACLLLVVALCYSLVLRRIAFLGQITVAALFASPLLYGGWVASGRVQLEHWIASALVTLYVFARETLKGIPDRHGDNAAGYRTVATQLGEPAALSVFRSAAAAFCVAAVAASLTVDNAAYLVAALVCAVAPTMHTVRLVSGSPSPDAINAAISFSGHVFALGVIPLLLMS